MENQDGKALRFFVPAAVLVAGSTLLSIVQLILLGINLSIPILSDESIIRSLQTALVGQLIAAIVIGVLFIPMLGLRDVKNNPLSSEGFKRTFLSIPIIMTIAFIANLVILLIFLSLGLVSESGYTGVLYLEEEHLADPMNVIVFFAVGCVGAPLFEELLYRRTAIPLMEERGMHEGEAIVGSTLLFALAHVPLDLLNGNVPGAIQHFVGVFIIGFFIGIVYVMTRNVVYPIIIHAVMNGIAFVAYIGTLSASLIVAIIFVGVVYLVMLPIGAYMAYKKLGQWISKVTENLENVKTLAFVIMIVIYLVGITLLPLIELAVIIILGGELLTAEMIMTYVIILVASYITVAAIFFILSIMKSRTEMSLTTYPEQ
ncbi:MAG: CPBP family intramembrane metalloprotease [Candidatus Lokiarchaeota archaeon]|nr:CPBP family intramembrane metalloprotease [Candidatus Lokiarchaeota archaeon]